MISELHLPLCACVGTAALLATSGCSVLFSPELPETTDVGGVCTTSADCTGDGEGFVCGAEGVCVNALTADCASFTGPLQENDAVVFGSILPIVENGSIGIPMEQAQTLAVQEINEAGGLPGARRIAVVNCDSSGNSEKGQLAAEHLVNVVGVPVIFGPAFSGVFIDVSTQVTAPADVLTISPSATSALITDIEDRGLAWRTVASDQFQGVAIADLVLIQGFTKVVALGKDDPYGRGLLNRVSEELIGELGEDNFYGRTFPDPAETAIPDYPSIVADVLTTLPDAEVAVLLGTNEVAEILDLIEDALIETSTTGQINLRYILADGGKIDEVRDLVTADSSLQGRIEGTEPDHQNGALYSAFRLRFQQRFGAPASIFTANAYDSVYLVAYAASSLSSGPEITGPAIATGMGRLISGRTINAGPSDFGDARTTLAAGSTINYDGASGPLDFQIDTGEAGTNVARWAFQQRPDGSFRAERAGSYTIDGTGRGVWDL